MTDFLQYQLVDVFSDHPFAGSQLAVVLGGDQLPAASMQALASEFNLAETTFPMPADSPQASYRLRIFTPSTELPFAGHPSVGSAWVMRQLGRVADGPVVQECGAGLLPLRVDGDRVTLSGGTPTVGDAVDTSAALAAVGLTAADFTGDEMRWAGVGLEFGYLHVRPDAVARCVPNPSQIRDLGGSGNLSVFSFVDGMAHARVFAVGAGVNEDPATGSAALGLGVWLAAAGLVAADATSQYVVRQGSEIGRPSRLDCAVRCEGGVAIETRVTGHVVPVGDGRIRVPA